MSLKSKINVSKTNQNHLPQNHMAQVATGDNMGAAVESG